MSLLEKMRGDRQGWYKVSDLAVGAEIAVPSADDGLIWDEIVSITPVGREQVWDVEVEGTHNFVGNDIFAHNTAFVVNQGAPANSLYVATNGNLGIGTNSPQGKLDISGSSASTDLTTFDGARALSIINTNTTANNSSGLDFRTMDANGLITTGAKIMSVYTSHTANAVSGDLAFLTRNAGTIAERMRLTSSGLFGIGTSSPLSILDIAGANNGTAPLFQLSSVASFATTTRFIVLNSGSVGIGTSSPMSKLSIVGDTRIKETTDSATAFVIENAMASSTLNVSTIDSAANLFSVASSTGQSYFDIMSGGNVGVGTSTPGYLLSVGSISAASGVVAGFANVDSECVINPTTTSFSCSSDKRLKKNITVLSDASALSKIASLNPISYSWNTEASSTLQHTGFIAQEVLPLFPDLVSTIDNGYYAVNYAGFAPYLAGAIRELNGKFLVPAEATSTLSFVLTADGKGIDLYKLATYDLSGIQALAAKLDAEGVRITALETRVEKLETGSIASASSSPITIGTTSLASAFNAFGAFISKGIAQFGSLVFDRFVAATNSAGTSSAGTVDVLAGNTVVQINNAYVTPSTKIFVTFNSPVTGSWYVSDKQDGSFRVVLSAAQTTDVSFDYFLVQISGQIATSTPAIDNQQATNNNSTDTTAPAITLLGNNPVRLSVGGTFVEPGVTATDNVDGDLTASIVTSGKVDTTVAGSYTITYTVTDKALNTGTASRLVTIASVSSSGDTTKPVVTLTGAPAVQITVGDTFTDPGATALDDVDGDLTAKIVATGIVDTKTAGSYTITYTATDAAKNVGTASRLITIASGDTTPPVVTLVGAAALQITVGDTFTDPGATATDNVDGDLTAKIIVTGTVNTATAGSYPITYTATDAAKNVGTVSRLVTVIAAPAAGAATTTPPANP